MIATLTMSPAVDLFATTEALHTDSKSRCTINHREPGGGGINVARNLKRLGLDVLAIFPAGGHHGQLLQDLLSRYELPFKAVPTAAETTQNIGLTELATGKQYHLVFPGAELTQAEWNRCLGALNELSPSPDYLVISGSLPPSVPVDFFARVAELAAQRGIKVVLDTAGPALKPTLEVGVHLAKLNREEFTDLGYTGDGDINSRLALMGQMVDQGYAEHLIVTLGPNGALMASRNGERLHAAPPPTPVVSHVGAGDSFVSVMTCQLARGMPSAKAFRYGVAAAAAAISTPGNQLDGLERVEALLARMK